nr:hypothetical protein [Thermosynechococcus sp. HN-54]
MTRAKNKNTGFGVAAERIDTNVIFTAFNPPLQAIAQLLNLVGF